MVGSAVPLSVLIGLLETNKNSSPSTFSQLAHHLSNIANLPVRNVSLRVRFCRIVFTHWSCLPLFFLLNYNIVCVCDYLVLGSDIHRLVPGLGT